MRTVVSADGYVNIITVLNMKRFIAGGEDEQTRFEALRGTMEFANVIKNSWGTNVSPNRIFGVSDDIRRDYSLKGQMSTEDVGFSTGVFRSLILEQETFPTYAVNKGEKFFSEHFHHLINNYQFSKLFLDIWNNWDIYIRPVYTGLFVLRLLRKYHKPETLLKIAKDVNRLQESFDIPSAFAWLEKIRNDRQINAEERRAKEESIYEFLKWLGEDKEEADKLPYIPAQSKLAMEVASLFVEEIAHEIPVTNGSSIRLARPAPRRSTPLHDSYVVYHLDRLYVGKLLKQKINAENNTPPSMPLDDSSEDILEQVSVEEVKNSFSLQQQLCNLLEGAVLKPFALPSDQQEDSIDDKERFPSLRADTVRQIMGRNLSSWEGELCLIMTRSAVFLPSRKYRNYELVVTTMSRSTSHIKYIRYWGAIERMAELVMSVRVLTQLIERLSYSLLGRIAAEMHKIRSELLKGDIKMNPTELSKLISEAANLQRLASLCQGLSDPHVWSRAEYGIAKAQRFIDELGIYLALEHIQRNIDAINQLGDHIDELYLGDLAETNNKFSLWSSVGLAGLSFALTILILPSFWADISQLDEKIVPKAIVSSLANVIVVGDIVAAILIIGAFLMLLFSIMKIINSKQISDLIKTRFKARFRS